MEVSEEMAGECIPQTVDAASSVHVVVGDESILRKKIDEQMQSEGKCVLMEEGNLLGCVIAVLNVFGQRFIK